MNIENQEERQTHLFEKSLVLWTIFFIIFLLPTSIFSLHILNTDLSAELVRKIIIVLLSFLIIVSDFGKYPKEKIVLAMVSVLLLFLILKIIF